MILVARTTSKPQTYSVANEPTPPHTTRLETVCSCLGSNRLALLTDRSQHRVWPGTEHVDLTEWHRALSLRLQAPASCFAPSSTQPTLRPPPKPTSLCQWQRVLSTHTHCLTTTPLPVPASALTAQSRAAYPVRLISSRNWYLDGCLKRLRCNLQHRPDATLLSPPREAHPGNTSLGLRHGYLRQSTPLHRHRSDEYRQRHRAHGEG